MVGMAWAKIESSGQVGGQEIDLTEAWACIIRKYGDKAVKICWARL